MALPSRQLFLSKNVVTEECVFDGGVLVDESGVIEQVLTREQADKLIKENKEKIEVIDGGDLALLAGVVDSHVHVNEPGRTAWEGFRTATAAAAAGGITTIVDMPLNSIPPTTTLENLKTKASAAKGNVYVDVGFWGGVIPGNQKHLKDLVKAGVVGFKCFLCPSGVEEFPNVNRQDLEAAFETLEGTGTVLAFHAEIENEEAKPKPKMKKTDPKEYQTYLESRPADMELDAIALITSLLSQTDVRVHIVHVSSADVVPLLDKARKARRAKGHEAWCGGVTAETCHHYLTLSAGDIPKGSSEYNVRVHIVHVSSADVVPLLDKARKARRAKGHEAWCGGVTAETCHHYLTLSAGDIPKGSSEYKCAPPIRDSKNKGAKSSKTRLTKGHEAWCGGVTTKTCHHYLSLSAEDIHKGSSEFKCAPPIRDSQNKEKLWKYLLEDKIELVVSDHSPCTPDLKCSNQLEAWGGISSVQFGLSLFWTEASIRNLDLSSISKYLSAGPAKLCGLQDRKGSLAPGLDADLVFFDPEGTFIVTPEIIRHKNKLTPYMKKELKGIVKKTYLCGQLIYEDGNVVENPKGKLLLY